MKLEHSSATMYLTVVVVCLGIVFALEAQRLRVHLVNDKSTSFVARFMRSCDSISSLIMSTQEAEAVIVKQLKSFPAEQRGGGVSLILESVSDSCELEVRRTNTTIGEAFERVFAEFTKSTTSFPNDVRNAFSRNAPAQVHPSPGSPMDAILRQQAISAFDNEYPSEAVDEVPGPHYVAPADPWADLPVREQHRRRAEAVKAAFRHSWKGYTTYAMGWDELQPRSRTGKNWNEMEGPHNAVALTVLDSITTMYVMGLEQEVSDALLFVKTKLSFQRDVEGSTFESTIRMLGSLLSMYELTGESDRQLLELAKDIGDRILWAYNTTYGLPHSTVGFASRRHFNQQWIGGSAVLSEFGTVQLEMRTLSFHTKNPTYDIKATHIMDVIEAKCPADMLCPCYMNMRSMQWTTDHVSLGALGDSFYEYVLKQYLLTGKTEPRYRSMFLKLVKGITDKLVFRSYPSGWAYVAEYRRGEYYHKMDHLACFVGGMLALGAVEVSGLRRDALLKLAGELTETCVKMYTRQKSGVSPEYVEFPSQQDFINGPGYYILRPETMESLFYMWRLTKDAKWRDYGWNIFRAIDRWCRVDTGGYSGLKEVNVKQPIKDNLMQSFWMAETLKYAYLLFADDAALDLSQWVLNTEAHPLRRRNRDPLDVWREYEAKHGEVPFFPPDVPGVVPTETEKMRVKRSSKHAHYVAPTDSYGEDYVDGPVDDEGIPFDVIHGQKGLPLHAGSGSTGPYVEEWALPSGSPAMQARMG